MAVCKFQGNSDMYGLGIRLGYYLQWFGAIIAAWIAPTEVKSLRFSIDLFVSASFLALIIITAQDVDSLEPVETYIILLLMFGAYLAIVPIYFWRLLTRCDPYWDPTRWPLVDPGALSANLSLTLLVGVLIFQYWFWFARVPDLDGSTCQQYGFLLAQVRLNSKASVVLNVLMYFWLGLVCLYLVVLKARHMLGFPAPYENRPKRKISRRHLKAHIELLQNLETWTKLFVAILVTLATELTIDWNEIEGVNSLASAGQAIPFVIGLGAVIRIIYVYFRYGDDDGEGSSDYDYRTGDSQMPTPLPVGQIVLMEHEPRNSRLRPRPRPRSISV
jgi:hypothetical protein